MKSRHMAQAAVVLIAGIAIYGSVMTQPRLGPTEIYPDPGMTPGKLYDATSKNAAMTICNHGNWSTKTIRPAASYTTALKIKQMVAYGDTVPDPSGVCMPHSNNTKCYEEDHLCSLEIGGDPKDPQNLWPEPYNTSSVDNGDAKSKDQLETYLNGQICAGSITPQQACTLIAKDWYRAYEEMTGKLKTDFLPTPSVSDDEYL